MVASHRVFFTALRDSVLFRFLSEWVFFIFISDRILFKAVIDSVLLRFFRDWVFFFKFVTIGPSLL